MIPSGFCVPTCLSHPLTSLAGLCSCPSRRGVWDSQRSGVRCDHCYSGRIEVYFWFQFIKRRSGDASRGPEPCKRTGAQAVGSLQGAPLHADCLGWGLQFSAHDWGGGHTCSRCPAIFLACSGPNVEYPGAWRLRLRHSVQGFHYLGLKKGAFSTSVDRGGERPV